MWPYTPARLVGMGCMRLSTDPDRDDERSIGVLHTALDAGVRLFDTADAYCRDDSEIGHNERLIARAIASWDGARDQVLVATKGGLTRPQGAWIPDGRGRHLRRACEASLRALALDRIPLYQLHAPDPRTPFGTSVRALQDLKDQGMIAGIGLCNVNLTQLEEARQLAEISAVQIELSPWLDDSILNGVIPYCIREGIRVLIHRPLGGPKGCRRIAADAAFLSVAAHVGVTPVEAALAWLADLSPVILPLPGATRPETARSIVGAHRVRLSVADRELLDARFQAAPLVRRAADPRQHPSTTAAAKGEVILLMGLPGAGKSTFAKRLVDDGYVRLNRDERGGTLKKLLPAFDREVNAGRTKIVLDNTYVTRKSRAAVILAAARHSLSVCCTWLDTTLDDAQVNAVERMIATHGRLLEPDEIRRASKRDPNTFAPGAQFRALRELEPPDPSEGFSRIETIRFARARDGSFANRAVIVWCDGVLWRSRSGARVPLDPSDMEVDEAKAEPLRRLEAEGWRVLGLSWQPEIGDTKAPEHLDAETTHLAARLGVSLDVVCCTHPAGPPVCWCRKPLPGLGVLLVQRHRLDAGACVYVGSGPQDPGFARKLGFLYREAHDFFRPTGRTDEL